MNYKNNPTVINSTKDVKALINNMGIDIVGIAELSKLNNMPVGLDIDLSALFKKYPLAIVIGAQHGKIGKNASGNEIAFFLEKLAYDILGYIEEKRHQCLIIHTEDEYDPDNRIGLLSLKVLAKQAGLGWQGRSLLTVSPNLRTCSQVNCHFNKHAPNAR